MNKDANAALIVITVAAGIVLIALFVQYVYYENSILAPAERENNGGSNESTDDG